MNARLTAICASAFIAATATPAHAAQRAFVASYGNDANTATSCLLANPCRGFSAAMTAVDPGGEVVALDAAGYAPVTITKSVTITANPGFYAGISVASGDGVTIATAGVVVTLRGLTINSVGGLNGVNMTNGARLSIENCVISSFAQRGLMVDTAAKIRVVDSLVRDNATGGVFLQGGATADVIRSTFLGNGGFGATAEGVIASTVTILNITDSTFAGNVYGVGSRAVAAGHTRATVARSTISNSQSSGVVSYAPSTGYATVTVTDTIVTTNGAGLVQSGGTATLESAGNNTVRQNGFDNTAGTITTVSPI